MKANELMMKDWVECFDATHKEKIYAQVIAMADGQATLLLKRDNCDWFLNSVFLGPIRITRSILLKNGFVLTPVTKNRVSYVYEISETKIEVFLDDAMLGNCVKIHTPCKSNNSKKHRFNTVYNYDILNVHELQHALRLCGIDRELSL